MQVSITVFGLYVQNVGSLNKRWKFEMVELFREFGLGSDGWVVSFLIH